MLAQSISSMNLFTACTVLLSGIVAADTIDLGYAKYSSSAYKNVSTYNNIRFAAPPVGNLRFKAPAAPLQETDVNDGSEGYTCPYAYPQNSLTTGGYNSAREQSEDCLFLDVYVPEGTSASAKLPVLVWIYGGGFTAGSKDLYPGYGLIEASNNSIIYVAMNYRLGAFGFSAGPTYGSQGGIANLGLLDQNYALSWVQSYIAKFGGDPTKITVAGESAGASSIMLQMAGDNGTLTPVFHRAIMQSPAVLPEFQADLLDSAYQNFSRLAGCLDASLACLQSANTSTLMAANAMQIQNNPNFGTFVYGPNVDNSFVAALPTVEILAGRFQKMPMLLSFNGNESAIFANPNVSTSADFDAQVAGFLPGVSAAQYTAISQQYPSSNYSSQYARLSQFIDDALVGCNVRTMAASNPNNAYVYEFDVGDAHHGSDVLYTFLNSFSVTSAQFGLNDADIAVAEFMQNAITQFVVTGNPTGIPNYSASQVKRLRETESTSIHDPNDNPRCTFWARASYDPSSAAILAASNAAASSSSSSNSNAASSSSSGATSSVAAAAKSTTSATSGAQRQLLSFTSLTAFLSICTLVVSF